MFWSVSSLMLVQSFSITQASFWCQVRFISFTFRNYFTGWRKQHLQDCRLWACKTYQRRRIWGQSWSKISNQVDSSWSCKLFQVFHKIRRLELRYLAHRVSHLRKDSLSGYCDNDINTLEGFYNLSPNQLIDLNFNFN